MLTAGSIAIWRLSPETLAVLAGPSLSRLAAAHALLSEEERRRAEAFRAEEDRRLYLAAHAGLRIVLGRMLGVSPAQLAFRGQGGAKPALLNQPAMPAPLSFNLAHTRGAVLIATAVGGEVGVDIERHRPIEDLEALAAAVMSRLERAAWDGLAPALRLPAFYRVWTRKEAYLKAIGLGLFRDLQAITVPIVPQELAAPARVDDRGDEGSGAQWRLCDLPVWDDFSAALCWQVADPLTEAAPGLMIHDLLAEDFPG